MRETEPIRSNLAPREYPINAIEASNLLTQRQTEVMKLLAHGLSHKDVAEALNLQTGIVMNDSTALHRKFGTGTKVELVLKALEIGMVDTTELVRPEFDPSVFSRLTPRERKITELITEGLTNKEIAYQLGISEQAVKNCLVIIFDKTNLQGRVNLTVGFLEARRIAEEQNGEDEQSAREIQIFPSS